MLGLFARRVVGREVRAAGSVAHTQLAVLAVAPVVVEILQAVDAETELETAKLAVEACSEVYLAVGREVVVICSRHRSTGRSHDTAAAVEVVDGKLYWRVLFWQSAEARQELALDSQVVVAAVVDVSDFLSDCL